MQNPIGAEWIIWNKCEFHHTQYQLPDLYCISCIVLTRTCLAINEHDLSTCQCHLICNQNTLYQGHFTPMWCMLDLSLIKNMMNNLYLSTIHIPNYIVFIQPCIQGYVYRYLYYMVSAEWYVTRPLESWHGH